MLPPFSPNALTLYLETFPKGFIATDLREGIKTPLMLSHSFLLKHAGIPVNNEWVVKASPNV